MFVLYAEQRPDIVGMISAHAGVTLADRHTTREPDFAVYGPQDIGDRRGKTWKDITPMLVVEVVSPGQAARDYQDKRRDYWDAGVGAYWIFDMEQTGLTVMKRGTADWVESRFDASQTYRPPEFPGLEIPVGSVLGL